jgi:hypothetical protein
MQLSKYYSRKSVSSKKSAIASSLRYLKHLPLDEFAGLQDSIHSVVKSNSLDSNQKVSINNQYRNWLLEHFNEKVPARIIIVKSPNLLDSLEIADSLRFAMLKTAKRLVGTPYVYAGTSPKKGFDCSGFTQYIYKSAGIEIPHNAQMQSKLSSARKPLKELKPGDLIFFGSWQKNQPRAAHAGIIYKVEGDSVTVIHCVSGGVKIEGENSSWDRYWINKVLFGISVDTLVQK